MSRREFHQWCAYFDEQPFDEFSRFAKPTIAAIAGFGAVQQGGDLDDVFAWLRNEELLPSARYSAADLKTMKSLGMKPPRRPRKA